MVVPFCLCQTLAPVAELVDALDSKSSSFGSGGSIPPGGTKGFQEIRFSLKPFLFGKVVNDERKQ